MANVRLAAQAAIVAEAAARAASAKAARAADKSAARQWRAVLVGIAEACRFHLARQAYVDRAAADIRAALAGISRAVTLARVTEQAAAAQRAAMLRAYAHFAVTAG